MISGPGLEAAVRLEPRSRKEHTCHKTASACCLLRRVPFTRPLPLLPPLRPPSPLSLAVLKFGRGNKTIVGMVSSEKEGFDFKTPIAIEGAVETWMTNVEAEMRRTLYQITKVRPGCPAAPALGPSGRLVQAAAAAQQQGGRQRPFSLTLSRPTHPRPTRLPPHSSRPP